MATPSFVNAGTLGTAAAKSVTPALPGSRVNGNLLVAWFVEGGSAVQTGGLCTVSSGWTLVVNVFDNSGTNSHNSAVAYRYVTGSEVAPTFTVPTTADTIEAQVLQYTGVFTSNPIGNVSQNVITGSSATLTCPAIISTSVNALAINIARVNLSTPAPPTPSGWNLETSVTSASGSSKVSDISLPSVGSSSGAISVTQTVTNYSEFIIEIRSQAPPQIYTISAAEGTYSLTGEVATLSIVRNSTLSVTQGTYSLTGQSPTLQHGRSLSASEGTYTLTGESVSFSTGKGILASQGTYTLTGESVTPNSARSIFTSHGVYDLTGKAVSFGQQFLLSALSGIYTLLGYPSTLDYKKLVTTSGTFTSVIPPIFDSYSLWTPLGRPSGRRTRLKSWTSPSKQIVINAPSPKN